MTNRLPRRTLKCLLSGGVHPGHFEILIKLDNLWSMPFPYVMPLHQAPTDGGDYSGFHFHIEFHPPLRRRNLLKFLAGPEIGGGNFLSDTSPEEKAAELRAVPSVR